MPRTFAIIIPTYDRAAGLNITLAKVAALPVPDGWSGEVLVIDNNSTDNTAAVVEALRGGFPLPLRRAVETRQGLNQCRNRGMEEAASTWLLYLDDDIKISPGWLEGFAEAVRTFDPDAVVGPVFPWFEGDVPSWCTGRVLESVTSAYSRKGDRVVELTSDQAHELAGCNFAVRRSLAREVGGFHPALDRSGSGMLAGGDFEFGIRLRRRGARVVYVPDCRVEHLVSRSKMSKSGLRRRWYGLGRTAKAVGRLHGDGTRGRQRLRSLVRMARFRLRAALQRRRSPDLAFRWELEALRLRGALFGDVTAFQPGREKTGGA